MKETKVNNVIFPIWILLFFPPVIFATLAGNFIIDSLVVLICFYVFRLSDSQSSLKTFYSKSILKVWIFGFSADIIGAVIMAVTDFFGDCLGLSYTVTSAITYDPFSHLGALAIVILIMMISSFFIFLFNYRFTFKKLIAEPQQRFKVALTIAIVTAPWTFMLPTKWFYSGF